MSDPGPSVGPSVGPSTGPGAPTYAERLWAPWWLWLVASVVAGTLGLAFGAPLGWVAGLVAWLVPQALVVWVLVTSAAVVAVDAGGLVAGRARLPWTASGGVRALDRSAAAALRGRDADPRAYLLLRPWVAAAVRVDVDDPLDPTPYWYVSTRHPGTLAEAVRAARARARHDASPPDEAG